MRFSTPQLTALAALGLAALAPAAAHAQNQDLFVANSINNTISRFAGTGTVSATPTTLADPNSTLNMPFDLAFDAHVDLFTANYSGSSTLTEFAPAWHGTGTLGAGTVVGTGGALKGPAGIASGPVAPPAVPEASGNVSLGLLLALGMGGVVMAARKKRPA